jgi:hypothetical protein
MRSIFAFNGDADGLCAQHQLRLAEGAGAAELVTGVKRDIGLLERIDAQAGDRVTVLDVSLDSNRAALGRLLASGVSVRYFDHHFAGEIPHGPGLEAHIDTAADVCTTILVDRFLAGRYRHWTIAAAYGDNLEAAGAALANEARLSAEQTATLARLGTILNYNGYGDAIEDLHLHPAALARAMEPYADPFAFVREAGALARLSAGYDEDMSLARGVRPERETDRTVLIVLPDAAWSRRVTGTLANEWVSRAAGKALAVLTPNTRGHFTVSVRAPRGFSAGADELCRQFPSGGGRKAAAGINDLPRAEIGRFADRLAAHFAA